MKNNKKGFFLAETIIMIALVTTIVAFLYPNVSKLYENYSNKVNSYDQVQDLYTLQAIKDYYVDNDITVLTKAAEYLSDSTKIIEIENKAKIGNIDKLYISKYMETPRHLNYNFNKYLSRMKKTTNSVCSYRLIGIFKKGEKVTYASIKLSYADIPDIPCGG